LNSISHKFAILAAPMLAATLSACGGANADPNEAITAATLDASVAKQVALAARWKKRIGSSSTTTTTSPTTATTAAVAWTRCAAEGVGSPGDTCSLTGTSQVRYGVPGAYTVKVVTGSIQCSDGAFGVFVPTPYQNFCDYSSALASTTAPVAATTATTATAPATTATAPTTTATADNCHERAGHLWTQDHESQRPVRDCRQRIERANRRQRDRPLWRWRH
jgi:hypothetical protein